jgi:hypothetical protein
MAAAGTVARSAAESQASAAAASSPHISGAARRDEQTTGRRGSPNSRQRLSAVNCAQRTPAGLPWGMPGMADEMDGAMQQAPQPGRHAMTASPGDPVPDGVLTPGRNRNSR